MKRRFVVIVLFLLLVSCKGNDMEKLKKGFNKDLEDLKKWINITDNSADKELCHFARSEWERLKNKNRMDASQWRVYLKKFPAGICSNEAKKRIEQENENFNKNLKILRETNFEAMKPLFKEGD